MRTICMPVGWGKHRKFTAMQKKLGARGIGVFLMLQDFVVENGEDWSFKFKDEGPDSLEFFAEEVGESKEFLLEVIGFVSKAEMVDFDGLRIVFTKAKELYERTMRSFQKPTNVNDTKPANVNVTNEVSTLRAPSEGDSLEAASSDLPQRSSNVNVSANVEENLEGFDCPLSVLVDDIGFAGCPFYKVLEREARECGVRAEFNASLRRKVGELISESSEEDVHGAFRVYIHEKRSRPINSYDPKGVVAVFVSCFSEKARVYRYLTVQTGLRKVNIAHDQDMLPEGPPLQLEAVHANKHLENVADPRPRAPEVTSKEKPWAQMKIEENAKGPEGDPLESLLAESAQPEGDNTRT